MAASSVAVQKWHYYEYLLSILILNALTSSLWGVEIFGPDQQLLGKWNTPIAPLMDQPICGNYRHDHNVRSLYAGGLSSDRNAQNRSYQSHVKLWLRFRICRIAKYPAIEKV